MTFKQQGAQNSDVNEQMTALVNNSNAVRAIASAVEGTLGPKGLDTMLVDQYGDVVITNDGVTILTRMEADHPAARMLINIARAQEEELGDGTTTATVMAGRMVSTGVELVSQGVPVARVIEGLKIGLKRAEELFRTSCRSMESLQDPRVYQVALVAGRGHVDIATLVMQAAEMVGKDKLMDDRFKLADTILALEGADSEVFSGVIVSKEPMNRQIPAEISGDFGVLVVDDALEPESVGDEALATEAGFSKYLQLQEEFKVNLQKIVQLGVKLVLLDRGISAVAEEFLADAGVVVIPRVLQNELRRVAEYTGARYIKRTGLKKTLDELGQFVGRAGQVTHNEKLGRVRIAGGKGKPMATILVSAATEEVVGERERIAKDAAGAVQAAFRGGVVPGGGSVELWAAREVEKVREEVKGMAAYGVDCVVEALRAPLAQIVANAGFNSLEKVGDINAAQSSSGKDSLGINCDTGEVQDMAEAGVLDPAPVKIYALKAAGEVAEAILRIDTIIKKREDYRDGRSEV